MSKRSSVILLAAMIAAAVIFIIPRFSVPPPEISETRLYMGTYVEITVLGKDQSKLKEAMEAGFLEIAKVEKMMSPYREDSDITRINNNAGKGPVKISPEIFEVIKRAMRISKMSGGAFDITISGLKGLWKIDPESPRVPTQNEINERLPLIDYKQVVLDEKNLTITLAKEGMRLDLGGIAKGYAVDKAALKMSRMGITSASVNAGGDLHTIGTKGGRPWNIGIQDPRDDKNVIGKLPVTSLAVATSGDYEKFMIVDGKRYCHIMDPKTGKPAEKCMSVTIVCGEAWLADGLATAVFVMGPEKGMSIIEKLEGVDAVVIDANGNRLMTSGIKGRVDWLNK
jgi:FAD:protein FMN transferase